MTTPKPDDIICAPACGTCGFLVSAGEYLREHHSDLFTDAKLKKHFGSRLFNGFDFDNTMLRIGSMNMLLHGVENPAIEYRDSLSEEHTGVEEHFTLVLANPPFAGSLDYESTSKDLQRIVKTKKKEKSRSSEDRKRTDQSFLVPKAEIAGNNYDLSINRYKEIVHVEVKYDSPKTIIKDLKIIEEEIRVGLSALEKMLG